MIPRRLVESATDLKQLRNRFSEIRRDGLYSPTMSKSLDSRGIEFIESASTTALWLDRLGTIDRRSSLQDDADVDVAIVGGGFSGLWTATTSSGPTRRFESW